MNKEKTLRKLEQFLEEIKESFGVEFANVVHGEWEKSPHLYGYVQCSVCHGCTVCDEWVDGKKWGYCPNCGADMRGGNK